MRVALVVPPLRAFSNQRMPLGLLSLAGSLRAARPGDEICVIDEVVPDTVSLCEESISVVMCRIIERLLAFSPAVVGFTCTTADFTHVLLLAERAKSADKRIQILVGGAHATLCPRDFYEHTDNVDFVFLGEGEQLLPAFLDALEGLSEFPGAGIWRRHNGTVLEAPLPPLIENLDALPFPAYDLVDMQRYTQPVETSIRPLLLSSVAIFSTRGCPYACVFCAAFSVWGRRVRYRSAKRIVDEILLLKEKWGIDAFFFYDDTFTLRREHVKAVCDELLERRVGLYWGCQTRVNHVDEERLKWMQRAGCIQLEFGVEAGNERGWRELNKGISREQVVGALGLARRMGFRTLVNFMINTPGETESDLADIARLLREIKPTACLVNVMTPYPGTAIAEQRGGLLVSDYDALAATDLREFRRFLGTKWRYASHQIPFDHVRRDLYMAFRLSSIARMLGVFDIFFGWKHIGLMVQSRWRKRYLLNMLRISWDRLNHLASEGYHFFRKE